MKNNTKSGIIVFILLVLAGIGCAGYSIWHNNRIKNAQPVYTNGNPTGIEYSQSDVVIDKKAREYIAAVSVTGTIENANSQYNQKWLLSTISALTKDENNVAIALYIDSPGGGVYEADEVFFALKDYKKTGKKIYVYMGPTAASGGYYIACPADKIYANRNTLTGSIGVISGQFIDASEFLENIGIKVDTIHSGANKTMGSYYSPMTEEQEEIMQSISDECYRQFTSIVSQNRNIPYEKVLELADGRVYTAQQALENKLIDKIGTWDEMMYDLRNHALELPYCKVNVYKYIHKQTFMESMMNVLTNIQNAQASAKTGVPQVIWDELTGFNSYPAYIAK